jgi:antitoxin component YwqK of YwqJK toxin-antitoxin module
MNKSPINAKGQQHGIWEKYYDNGQLYYKGTYINGQRHGPWEQYHKTGQLCYKQTFIQGKLDGLILWYNRDGTTRVIEFYAR